MAKKGAKPAKSKKKSPAPKKSKAGKSSPKKVSSKKPVPAKKPKPKKAAPRKPPRERRKPESPTRKLLSAIDLMQDAAPGATVQAKEPPPNIARTPWILVVRFSLPGGSSYDDVLAILIAWRSRKIERLIGAQRLCRIQVRYVTERGVKGEYTLAEIGPWELAISRAYERVGIRDDRDESLQERYGEDSSKKSDIDALLVWFSSADASEVS